MDEDEWRRRAPQVRQRIEEIKRAMAWRPAWTERQESRARDSWQTSTGRFYGGGLVEEEVGFKSPFDGSKLMERHVKRLQELLQATQEDKRRLEIENDMLRLRLGIGHFSHQKQQQQRQRHPHEHRHAARDVQHQQQKEPRSAAANGGAQSGETGGTGRGKRGEGGRRYKVKVVRMDTFDEPWSEEGIVEAAGAAAEHAVRRIVREHELSVSTSTRKLSAGAIGGGGGGSFRIATDLLEKSDQLLRRAEGMLSDSEGAGQEGGGEERGGGGGMWWDGR